MSFSLPEMYFFILENVFSFLNMSFSIFLKISVLYKITPPPGGVAQWLPMHPRPFKGGGRAGIDPTFFGGLKQKKTLISKSIV